MTGSKSRPVTKTMEITKKERKKKENPNSLYTPI